MKKINSAIQVDSRRCGSGKTHGTTGLISYIQKLYQSGDRIMVVLPSIKLAAAYYFGLKTDCPTDCQVINSEVTPGVGVKLNSLSPGTQIVIITQAAFRRQNWTGFAGWHLVMDEMIDPYGQIEMQEQSYSTLNLDWPAITQCDDRTISEVPEGTIPEWADKPEYRRITFDPDLIANNIADRSFFAEVLRPNTITWIKTADYQVLLGKTSKRINMYTELDPAIMLNWRSVRIAAAAFEYSFLAAWLSANNLHWELIPGMEFTDHINSGIQVNGEVVDTTDCFVQHSPDLAANQLHKWSKSRAVAGCRQLDIFRQHIQENTTPGERVLVLRNKSAGGQIPGVTEVIAPHNAHGSNDYADINTVVFEAATNLPEAQVRFFKHQVPGLDTFAARSGLDFYQILMRCSLRDDNCKKVVNVYTLDSRMAEFIPKLFDNIATVFFDLDPLQVPLTDAMRASAHYLKKKHGLGPEWTTRHVLEKYTPVKAIPLTEPERAKANRLIKKYNLQDSSLTQREILNQYGKF
jgi:hypothetical protein